MALSRRTTLEIIHNLWKKGSFMKKYLLGLTVLTSVLLSGCDQLGQKDLVKTNNQSTSFLRSGETYCFISKDLTRALQDQKKQWFVSGVELFYVQGEIIKQEGNFILAKFSTVMSAEGPLKHNFGSAWINLNQIDIIAQSDSGFCK